MKKLTQLAVFLGVIAVVGGSLAQAQMQNNQMHNNNNMQNNNMNQQQQNCFSQGQQKQQAHNNLNMCLGGWTRNFMPQDPDPSDDCSSKLKTFITAARADKKCNSLLAKRMKH